MVAHRAPGPRAAGLPSGWHRHRATRGVCCAALRRGVCPMEWWHIGPLVLALLVFLVAGTIVERHVESAVLRFVNHRQPQCQSQATVGVTACDAQVLRQQQDDWLHQQLLKHKKELEEQEQLLRKLQQEELQGEEQLQQDELLQQRLMQKKEELEKQELHQKPPKQELQKNEEAQQQQELLDQELPRKQMEFQKLLEQQHTETLQEVKPSEKKSLPNTSVTRQLSASQAAQKPKVVSSHLLQEPPLVQSLHQQAAQPINQQSLQQLQSQQRKEQETMQESLQQQQQQQIQVQGLLVKPQSQQHSDRQPALPFVAVSEKSILKPTSKTTIGSKAMDM
ncbi:adenylate cyclase, terminal-differentiation specific-like isoform X2 [Cydia splendana]|uniref:adenylate cyclase, terminal-differentiation specific-like isoform X2 n=1 Tax=Cydia splendana TaxID=1100963 RepID=UPI00300DABA5